MSHDSLASTKKARRNTQKRSIWWAFGIHEDWFTRVEMAMALWAALWKYFYILLLTWRSEIKLLCLPMLNMSRDALFWEHIKSKIKQFFNLTPTPKGVKSCRSIGLAKSIPFQKKRGGGGKRLGWQCSNPLWFVMNSILRTMAEDAKQSFIYLTSTTLSMTKPLEPFLPLPVCLSLITLSKET